MEKFHVINGSKKSTESVKQRKLLGTLRAAMIVLVILMILFVFARLLSDRNIASGAQSVGSSMNCIYEISPDAVLDMQACNGGLAVLTPTNVLYISRSGSTVYKNPHKYSNPAICVCADKILLFDRGSVAFRIENSSGVQFESTADQPIINAGFGKKGNYVLSTKGSDSLTTMLVYDKNHRLQFQWKCASEYISFVDLSPNGKSAAAIVTGAKNAALYAKVYMFNLSSEEPIACYDFEQTLFSLQYLSNRKVSVLGENVYSILTPKAREDCVSYSAVSDRQAVTDRASGNTGILLAKYGNDSLNELFIYSESGKELMKKEFLSEVYAIDCNSRYAAASFDGKTEIYSFAGKTVGCIDFGSSAKRILLDGTNIYILTSSGISVYGVSSHVTVQNNISEPTTVRATKDDKNQTTVAQTGSANPIAAFTEKGLTEWTAESSEG